MTAMTPTPQDDLDAAAIKWLEMRGFVVVKKERREDFIFLWLASMIAIGVIVLLISHAP